jgi:hypothetical protein
MEIEWLTPQLPWIGDGGVDVTAADATAEVASTLESLLGFGCWTAGDGEGLVFDIGGGGATTPETSSTPSSMRSVTLTLWRCLCTVMFLSFCSSSLPRCPSHLMTSPFAPLRFNAGTLLPSRLLPGPLRRGDAASGVLKALLPPAWVCLA